MFGIINYIRAQFLLASANRVCEKVRECIGHAYEQGARPITVIGDISAAVGIDPLDGTVWGVRPETAVSIRHGWQIRHDWRNDPALIAQVIHA